MIDREELIGESDLTWQGFLDPSHINDDYVAANHALADAAKVGDWSKVLTLLDDPARAVNINRWCPGGKAWFTVLHQAAWHGAPPDVAAALIARGALTSLTDSRGRTALDIRIERDDAEPAAAQDNSTLREFLEPPPSPLSAERIRALDRQLAAIIDRRIRGVLFDGRDPHRVLRYPPVAILHEVPGQRLWFPVPGMYGGFVIVLRQGYLETQSWSRIVGGSGEAHVITHEGAVLVDEGFV